MFANCRSQLLIDRLGKCLKLFESTDIPSSHAFAFQFRLAKYVCEQLVEDAIGILHNVRQQT